VTVTQLTFSAALTQLSDIGRQLREVADPDDVLALETEAEALAEHCRALLRSPRKLRATAAPRRSEPIFRPAVTADGGVITGPAGEAEPIDLVSEVAQEEPGETAVPSHTVVLPEDPVRSQQY
jgi:hypothetical protein